MVRLKVINNRYNGAFTWDFNSRMVRLKVSVCLESAYFVGFQFQNGTIKSRSTTQKNKLIIK